MPTVRLARPRAATAINLKTLPRLKKFPRVQKRNEIDLCLEGGGTLGTAYVGVLRALDDNGLVVRRVVGNSAGAITASMIAAGYSAQAIQWLTGTPGIRSELGSARRNGVPTGVGPISFDDFLDFTGSAADISPRARRRTALWKALKNQVIDKVLDERLVQVPTRARLSGQITNQVVALSVLIRPFRNQIRGALNSALVFLPARQPRVRDLLPRSLESLRQRLADILWVVIAENVPGYLHLANFTQEGGFAAGDVFLTTMKRLLGAKIHGDPNKRVTFRDLPIELAVCAADAGKPLRGTGTKLVVYSRRTHPSMDVAEAVRRSMSIPLLFEPRRQAGRDIVDGGVMGPLANYPIWLLSGAGTRLGYMMRSLDDPGRAKLGFVLDESLRAPASWGSGRPKWTRDPGFAPLLKRLGIGDGKASEPENVWIDRVLRTTPLSSTDRDYRRLMQHAVMKDLPYHETAVPLFGFSWLDFEINNQENEEFFLGMADRGWKAAMRTLTAAKLAGSHDPADSPFWPPE